MPEVGEFYTYMLLDPRYEARSLMTVLGRKVPHEPFYIGKGKGRRCYVHLKKKNDGRNTYKINKIKAIRAAGLEPQIFIVKSGMGEQRALSLEASLIIRLGRSDAGNGCLTNRTDGMDGCKSIIVTSQTRAKMRIAALARKLPNDETRHKMSISQRMRNKPSAETRKKCSESLSQRITIIVDPNGAVELTNDLRKYCEDKHFNFRTFSRQNRKLGSYMGWKFVTIKIHHRDEKLHKNWFEMRAKLLEHGINLRKYG